MAIFLISIFIKVWSLFDVILQRENGEQHADENDADEAGDEKQHQRFGERHGGFQIPVQVKFRDAGHAHEFGVELAAFFRDRNHFQHRAGKKDFAVREALAEPSALLHALDGLADGIHENLVADGPARDVEAVNQRHTGAEQCAQHPAEARHRKLSDERADDRRFQNHSLPHALAFFGSEPHARKQYGGDDSAPDEQAIRPHEMAHADDDLRDDRQRTVDARKHRLEFWDEKNQQHRHDQ